MQEKVALKKISTEKIAETRKKLPRGHSKIIAEMIFGRYKDETINKMFIGARTMKPVVFEAANKLIETINNLKNTVTDENSM
ncbi:MAG: hypothetical protein Q7J06_04475 [Bacteroidales bacterium]|nr:hypothetical protein [Bacteroidales bacterium]